MKAERVTGGEAVERVRDASSGPRLILSPRSVDEFRAKIAVGDILSGRVLDALDKERVVVRFLDFNIVAQSETPLTRGETVRAEVTAIQEQVFMRLIPPGSALERATALLAELGVPVNRANLETLALMARAGVPLTSENLRDVFAALQAPGNRERSASVVVLGRALGVPLTPATLETLETLTETPTPLGARLASVTAELRTVLPTLAPDESGRLRELESFVNTLLIRPDTGNVREQVSRFLNALGLGAENRLANGATPEPSLKTALWAAQADIALRIAEATARGGNPALLESLRGNLDGLARQLDAFQLLARIASPDLPNLYLQFAYWAGVLVPATLQVRARRHKPEAPTDDENTDIEFSVRTERWGVVRVRMAIREGVVTGRVEVETPEAQAFVAPRLRSLAARIGDVGYRLQSLTSRVHGAPEEPVLSRPQLAARFALDLVV
jgi:hypothetical protein